MQAVQTVYDKPKLVDQLRGLGLGSGDTALVRVGFRAMGRLQAPGDRTFVAALLDTVGPRGTILALTHSPAQWIFAADRSYVFDPKTAPYVTGRFAETLGTWDGAYRSRHPTASMAAVGPRALELLGDHDERSTSFAPVERLIALGGKQINIGCHFSSPGFATIHYLYETLGLATRSLVSGLLGCYHHVGDAVRWFRQYDVPGCSLGYHKFYPLYQAKNLFMTGKVGDADAFLIGAAEAYAVEREAVAKAPKFSLCDKRDCFWCRGTRWFNWRDMPSYYLTQVPGKIVRRLGRRR